MERVEVLRRGAGLRRSSPLLYLYESGGVVREKCRVSALYSQLVPLRMLLHSSSCSKDSWFLSLLFYFELSEISSLTRRFVALYLYRVL